MARSTTPTCSMASIARRSPLRVWSVAFGNGAAAGPEDSPFFTAGPDEEEGENGRLCGLRAAPSFGASLHLIGREPPSQESAGHARSMPASFGHRFLYLALAGQQDLPIPTWSRHCFGP